MNTTFRVAGIDYQIIQKPSEEMNGHLGLADFNNQSVIINQNCSEQTKKIAIFHEILHLISDAYGLGLTEQQVKIGTHALIAFLADNPELNYGHR